LRGGSWNNNPNNLRASNRNRNKPDNRNNNNGVRCAQYPPYWPESGCLWRIGVRIGGYMHHAPVSESTRPNIKKPSPASRPCRTPGRGVTLYCFVVSSNSAKHWYLFTLCSFTPGKLKGYLSGVHGTLLHSACPRGGNFFYNNFLPLEGGGQVGENKRCV